MQPELGIPGLDYLPRPESPPESPPPVGGGHRRPRSGPLWSWLAVAAVLAVLASAGIAWTIGGMADSPRRPPAAPAPAAPTDLVAPPGETALPLPTVPEFTTPVSPSPSRSVTGTPAPSATAVRPPSPSPRLIRVPDVVGDRRSEAEATLRAAGFAVSVRLVPAPSPRQARRVLGQLPGAGQLARPGLVVVLLVGDR
jgi:hypothetical protein